jgi:hypothetical protein
MKLLAPQWGGIRRRMLDQDGSAGEGKVPPDAPRAKKKLKFRIKGRP